MIDRHDLIRFLGLQPGCPIEAVAGFFAAGEATAQEAVAGLAGAGLVRQTARGFCLLTDEGRAERERLYADEAAANRGGACEALYETFEPVNEAFLDWATRWQRRDGSDDTEALLLAQLWEIDAELQPLLDRLRDSARRFEYHQRALTAALKLVEGGDLEYLLSPLKPSYHTCWFRLHQDWLEALGRKRG